MPMPTGRAALILIFAISVAVVPSLASRSHRGPTSGHWRVSSRKAKAVNKSHGQRQIDSTRTAQIQEALIKQNYLSGEPSGQWDQQTESAMQKFQADHGWQTKLMPDSRALIKLGLGPNAAAPGAQRDGSQSLLSGPSGGFAGGNSLTNSNSVSQ